jgi:hypothetical protein
MYDKNYYKTTAHRITLDNNLSIVEQVIRYNLVWVSLRLINREA